MKEFDFDDMARQLTTLERFAKWCKVFCWFPGLGVSLPSDFPTLQEIRRQRVAIKSMTPSERQAPEIIDGSRRHRIASGSGTTADEVSTLIERLRYIREVRSGRGVR